MLEHGELVVDLRTAGNEDERPLDVSEEPAEVVELVTEEQPGVGGQQVRDRLGGRVGAVRRPERVVHVDVHPRRELGRVARVVLRLAGVEPCVLENANAIVAAEQIGEPRGDRGHRERRSVLLRLGTAEVRAHGHIGGPMIQKPPERR